jgi:hypothetical protein
LENGGFTGDDSMGGQSVSAHKAFFWRVPNPGRMTAQYLIGAVVSARGIYAASTNEGKGAPDSRRRGR